MRHTSLAWLAVIAAGCYSSYPFVTGTDGESPPDVIDADTALDIEDTAEDEILTEVDADIPHDGTTVCDEASPYHMTVSFWFDDYGIYDDAHVSLACGVPAISGGTGLVRMLLWCEDGGEHMLAIQMEPDVSLVHDEIPEEVKIDYVSQNLGEGWAFRWFRMRDLSGNLLLAVVQSNRLAPPGIDAADWYAPAWVNLADGLCPILNPGCYTTERLAVDFVCRGNRRRIFEDNRGWVGDETGCFAQVGEAFRTHVISCADLEMPSMYFAVLLVM